MCDVTAKGASERLADFTIFNIAIKFIVVHQQSGKVDYERERLLGIPKASRTREQLAELTASRGD